MAHACFWQQNVQKKKQSTSKLSKILFCTDGMDDRDSEPGPNHFDESEEGIQRQVISLKKIWHSLICFFFLLAASRTPKWIISG